MLSTTAISVVALTIFSGLLVWAAVSDFRRYIIPNQVSLGALALYPVYVLSAPEPVNWQWALVMAGVWTSVCVMFPALDAKAAGFKVYAVTDASGDPSELASRTTLARLAQAGVVPITANAVLGEVHRTWNRPEAAEIAKLYTLVSPNYAAVAESHKKLNHAK